MVQAALLGESVGGVSPTALAGVIAADCEWSGPWDSCRGPEEVMKRVESLRASFSDPRFAVNAVEPVQQVSAGAEATGKVRVHWSFSGTWPSAWKPRMRLSGTADVTGSGWGAGDASTSLRVSSVDETWTHPATTEGLILQQIAPRFFDALNLYNSPHAETPEWRMVDKCEGYEVREMHQHLCIRASYNLDPDLTIGGSRLPDFVFGYNLKSRGRNQDTYIATAPVSVQVEATTSPHFPGKVVKRVTQLIPVPSVFGMGQHARNKLPELAILDPEEDAPEWMEIDLAYHEEPTRRIAVAPAGVVDTISQGASDARSALLESLRRDGRRFATSELSGKPLFRLMQTPMKCGWAEKNGKLSLAIYGPRPDWMKPQLVGCEVA